MFLLPNKSIVDEIIMSRNNTHLTPFLPYYSIVKITMYFYCCAPRLGSYIGYGADWIVEFSNKDR